MSDPERVPEPPAAAPDRWTSDPSVLRLDDGNFRATIDANAVVLVMFYAPWCGHCKRLKPAYAAAAEKLQAEGHPKCLAAVDCTESPDVAEEFQIAGFPTLKLFRNGKYVEDYKGGRTAEDIRKFVLGHVGGGKDEL